MSPFDPMRTATTWIHAALERHEVDLVRYAAQRLGGDLDRARDIVQVAFLPLCNEQRDRCPQPRRP